MKTKTKLIPKKEVKNRIWITCSDCGKVRMNTPSGSVCPDGHGKIHKRVPAKVVRELQKYRAMVGLPNAKRFMDFKAFYSVPKSGRKYWKRTSLFYFDEKTGIKAIFDGRVIFLMPFQSRNVETAIRRAKAS